jgi:hypothetical protein
VAAIYIFAGAILLAAPFMAIYFAEARSRGELKEATIGLVIAIALIGCAAVGVSLICAGAHEYQRTQETTQCESSLPDHAQSGTSP